MNEGLTFSSMYFDGVETRLDPSHRNYDGEEQVGRLSFFSNKIRPYSIAKGVALTTDEHCLTHRYIFK